ncbi:DnaJ-like protein DjlA [hydrothermal vent metagenome]|uniref:DnaJ-like protein DjlA n=1 Tax=hydrothermal vent metagenome TaxID=652676 RepID=A0A3B1BCV0_9ZZZZ
MSWWGKVVGGAFGFMLGGPLGAVLGAALGHQFDKGLNLADVHGGMGNAFAGVGNRERVQTAFFTALFSVMGHVAKADGRVSADEIAMAKQIMQQMALDESQRKLAIDLFNQGKQDDFDLDGVIQQFRQEAHRRSTILQMYMEILVHAAYADSVLDPAEQRLLERISEMLGFSQTAYQQLHARVQAQRQFHAGGQTASPEAQLKDAYEALGVSESASDTEVKKAYRRLMSQHHPDKLVSKGLPEEMIKLANEKTHEIKAAYETIKKMRKV